MRNLCFLSVTQSQCVINIFYIKLIKIIIWKVAQLTNLNSFGSMQGHSRYNSSDSLEKSHTRNASSHLTPKVQRSLHLPSISNHTKSSSVLGSHVNLFKISTYEPIYHNRYIVEKESARKKTIDAFTNEDCRVNPEVVRKLQTKNILLKRYAELEEIELDQKRRERGNEVKKKIQRQKGSMFIADLWDRGYYKSVLKHSGIDKLIENRRRAKWQSNFDNFSSKYSKEIVDLTNSGSTYEDVEVFKKSKPDLMQSEAILEHIPNSHSTRSSSNIPVLSTPNKPIKRSPNSISVEKLPLPRHVTDTIKERSEREKDDSYLGEAATPVKKEHYIPKKINVDNSYNDSFDISPDISEISSKIREGSRTTKRNRAEAFRTKYHDFFTQVDQITEDCKDATKDKDEILRNIKTLGKVIVPLNAKRKQEEQIQFDQLRKNNLIKEFSTVLKQNEKKRNGYNEITQSLKEQIRKLKQDVREKALGKATIQNPFPSKNNFF